MIKALLAIIAGLIIGMWYLSPIFKPFPEPTGQFSVGTSVIEFNDLSRKEIYSENPEETRSVVVRFFYPAQTTKNLQKYPYLGAKMPYFEQYLSTQYYLTQATAKLLLRNINTHTFINAPLSAELNAYPIILFSHGLLGYPSDTYLTILENLASHGFIVAAIDHSYLNALTLFANGKVTSSLLLSEQFNKMSQKEQKEFQTKAIEIYKADMKFVIDELAKLNENPQSIFYHHLDLNRIAAMGHSAGGTASIEFCRTDNRCKAAIDLDGWYDQAIGDAPINKPLLLVFAEKSIEVTEPTPEYLKRKELTREQYYEREKNIAAHKKELCQSPLCSMIIIPHATHSDFDDMMFLKWPLRAWNAVEPYTTIGIINTYIINFFNNNLKKVL
jgi:dienelactone hydrolase